MWLVLDASLQAVNPSAENIRSSLEALCYAVGRGEHALAANPATVRHLLTAEFSPFPRAVLRNLLESAPDILARLGQAMFRVRIVAEGIDPDRVDASEWTIPIDWIRLNGVPTSVVLAENTRDANLFKIAAAHSLAVRRTGNAIRIDVANGGGADTPRILQEQIADRRAFIFCVTDSDRRCPTAPRNHTSAECARISAAAEWVSMHYMLEEREIENVVPVNLLEDTFNAIGAEEQVEKLNDLRRVCELDARAWSFFDLKEGTPLKLMFGACSGFWLAFKEHPVCRSRANEECIAAGGCHSAECGCQIAPSLGARIVEHVIHYLSQQSTHSAAKRVMTSSNRDRWLEIGALVGAWGASSPKLRS